MKGLIISLPCSFNALIQLFEKVCAYIIYRADSLLFYLFDVSILHSWGNLSVQYFQVLLLCVDLFANTIIQCCPSGTGAGERECVCMSKSLCSVYSLASHPEVHLRPSLPFFAWVSCQSTSVISGVTSNATVFERFCFLIWEHCADSETRSSYC